MRASSVRARLTPVSPGITGLARTAEDVPLPDRPVDAVVVGQAYHWFDTARAHLEIARVLRPNGVFAGLWNDADLSAAWAARFVEVIDGAETASRGRPVPDSVNVSAQWRRRRSRASGG